MIRYLVLAGLALVTLLVIEYAFVPYVPKDLDDAHATLLRDLPKAELDKIKAMTSEDEMSEYHMGLGMGMRNGWGLWQGSRLSRYFNKRGIHHPDDMSGIILDTFWCRLHNQPFRLEERVAFYQTYWKAVANPAKTAVTPKGHAVDWEESLGRGTKTTPREIHIGIDPIDQTFWIYEYDKGVYAPTPELMDFINHNDFWKTSYKELVKQRQSEGK